ncbi:MAG TPA: GNAT family N-acetyltransferase [Kofleriaceae bacterium]|nr:GNAT family N-acetyltransferase [Kofleriaceae bacterium]
MSADASMTLRHATVDDYDAYARLSHELDTDDPTPTRSQFVERLCSRTIVAVEADRVVGYALYERMTDAGYIRNVVSDPDLRRRGIGRALMEELRAIFVAGGATRWCLNVKPDNAAAIALYEHCGMRTAYRSAALRLPREATLASPPPSLRLSRVAPADDALLEQQYELLPGQLASSRAKGGRELLQLVRDGETVGVAVWTPGLGAFPFRVREPALGAPFLAHLRTRATLDALHIQVVVEDDEALRAEVLGLGARVALEMLHLRGPLPSAGVPG